MYFKAFALTGRIADLHYTQGVALGYELLPFQGVLLIWASWPSGRAAVGFWTFMAMLLWASWPFGRCCYCFKLPNSPSCTVEITQHALKGQKLLAQGIALGMRSVRMRPVRAKALKYT